jgi:hypothetical protein
MLLKLRGETIVDGQVVQCLPDPLEGVEETEYETFFISSGGTISLHHRDVAKIIEECWGSPKEPFQRAADYPLRRSRAERRQVAQKEG